MILHFPHDLAYVLKQSDLRCLTAKYSHVHVLLSIHRPDKLIVHFSFFPPPYPWASFATPPATRETEGNRTQHTCVLVPFLLFLLAYC